MTQYIKADQEFTTAMQNSCDVPFNKPLKYKTPEDNWLNARDAALKVSAVPVQKLMMLIALGQVKKELIAKEVEAALPKMNKTERKLAEEIHKMLMLALDSHNTALQRLIDQHTE